MRTLNIGPFDVKVDSDKISVNAFSFSPGEADAVSKFVGLIGSMGKFKTLPKEVKSPPFLVEFQPNGNCILIRSNTTDQVEFKFGDADTLIDAIKEGVNVSTDERLLRPQPRMSNYNDSRTDDVY